MHNNHIKFLFLVYFIITMLACDKETVEHPTVPPINKPPVDFLIAPERITDNLIEVSYTESTDPEFKKVKYRVYLNGTMIADTQEYKGSIVFTDLIPETRYTVNVVAFDEAGKTNSQSIYIKTLAYGARIVHTRLQFEGRAREYGVYYPSGSLSKKLPLVIFLHGAAGIVWPEMIDYYFTKLAEQEGFIFLQPQALRNDNSPTGITAWDAHNFLPWNDVEFINSIIDTLDHRGSIDLNRIYVSGMSNGGYMTFTVAEKLQERIAAIAPIAGLMDKAVFSQYNMQKPMPLCYMHGTADATVEIGGDEFSVGWPEILSLWLNINAASHNPVVTELPDINIYDNSTVTRFEYYSYSGKSDIIFYQINNGVHSIPGIETPANKDINAFDEIWKFFKDYTL